MSTAGEASRRWRMPSASALQEAPGMDAANSSDPPNAGQGSSATKPRAISVHAAPRLFGVRDHEPRPQCAGEHHAAEADQRDPLGPSARPAKRLERLLASVQVGDGSARRRVEPLLQHIHARNGEKPLARKSTRRKRPNVSRSFKMSQKVSGPSDNAARGLSDAPPLGPARRKSSSATPRGWLMTGNG